MNQSSRAFTLVEIALVMIIVGFLLSRLLVPLSTTVDQERMRITQQRLQEIKEALIGYAVINRHLPCPDADQDGRAESYEIIPTVCDGGTNDTDAYLPWADLGVSQYDGWNRPFRYRVDGAFSDGIGYHSISPLEIREFAIDNPPITEHFLSVQNLAGRSLADELGANYQDPNLYEKSPPSSTSSGSSRPRNFYYTPGQMGSFGSEAVAIVFSCGKNGRPDGRLDPNNPTQYVQDFNFPDGKIGGNDYNTIEHFSNDADGQVNTDAQCTNPAIPYPLNTSQPDRKTNYIQDNYVEGSFDDILVWLPRNLLIQRMVAAGTWSADSKRYGEERIMSVVAKDPTFNTSAKCLTVPDSEQLNGLKNNYKPITPALDGHYLACYWYTLQYLLLDIVSPSNSVPPLTLSTPPKIVDMLVTPDSSSGTVRYRIDINVRGTSLEKLRQIKETFLTHKVALNSSFNPTISSLDSNYQLKYY